MTDTHPACKTCEADGYCATYQMEHWVEGCGIVQRAEGACVKAECTEDCHDTDKACYVPKEMRGIVELILVLAYAIPMRILRWIAPRLVARLLKADESNETV
jgi:hypothetical protein